MKVEHLHDLCDLMRYQLNKHALNTMTTGSSATWVLLLSLLFSTNAHTDTSKLSIHENNIPPVFSAKYQIKAGGMNMGEIKVGLAQNNTHEWIYSSRAKTRGLAALISGGQNMSETSHLQLIGDNIRPVFFERIKVSGSENKSERVTYAWHKNNVHATYKDRVLNDSIHKYSLDLFTLQLSLMSNINNIPEKTKVTAISKAKLKDYLIIKHANETLETVYGLRNCVVIERKRGDASYKIWADADTHGLPIQIQHLKKGKAEYTVSLVKSSLHQSIREH